MIILPLLMATALAPAAGSWTQPLWDAAPATADEHHEQESHRRPAWWGRQCGASHPTLIWNWLDAIKGEEGVAEELPELVGSTVARLMPRAAPSTHLGRVREGEEVWGGPPMLATRGVLDLCYLEIVTVVAVTGSGADAFEELRLETRGRGTVELRYGHDLLLRPSRFVWANAARGLDAAAIGVGGTMGWAVAAPGGEAAHWLVRPLSTLEVGPRFLWDVSSWLAITVDVNAVVTGPADAIREWQDGARGKGPSLKVVVGGVLKAPEEPLVEFFRTR